MTKKQMTETLQKMEAATFLEMQRARQRFGSDNVVFTNASRRWAALHDAMVAIGVESDNQLPDNQSAIAIVANRQPA